MSNNFKATLDDLPEILAGINFQLQRIADALDTPKPNKLSAAETIRAIMAEHATKGDDDEFFR